jgi:hypothetical protein
MTPEEKLGARLERARRRGYIVTRKDSHAYVAWSEECAPFVDMIDDILHEAFPFIPVNSSSPFIAVLRHGDRATVEIELDHLWDFDGDPTSRGAAMVLDDALAIVGYHHRRWLRRWANDLPLDSDSFPGGWRFDRDELKIKVFDVSVKRAIFLARRFAASVVKHRADFAIRPPKEERSPEELAWSAQVKAFVDAHRDADGNIVAKAEHLAAARAENPGYTDEQVGIMAGGKTIIQAYMDFMARPYIAESP